MMDNKVIIAGAILFIILSPGVLLTIPANKGCEMFMAISNKKVGCATSFVAVAVHALVWAIAFKLLYDKVLKPSLKTEAKEEIKEAIRRRRRRRRRR
jgi:hypothetical protein